MWRTNVLDNLQWISSLYWNQAVYLFAIKKNLCLKETFKQYLTQFLCFDNSLFLCSLPRPWYNTNIILLKSVCITGFYFNHQILILSKRRFISYRNEYIDLQSISIHWFQYDKDLHHEIFKRDLHVVSAKQI